MQLRTPRWIAPLVRLSSDLQYYVERAQGSWKQVWIPFLLLLAITGSIRGITLSFSLVSTVTQRLQIVSDAVIARIPTTQELQWNGETITFTHSLPTILDFPEADQLPWPGVLAHYYPTITSEITTAVTGLPIEQQPLLIVSETGIWTRGITSQWSSSLVWSEILPSASAAEPLRWNSQQLATVATDVHTMLRRIVLIAIWLLPVLSIFLLWLDRIWFALVESTLIWVLGRVMGIARSWQLLVKLSLMVVITADYLELLGSWLYPNLTWSLFHASYWILLVLSLLQLSYQFSKQTKTPLENQEG